MKKLSKNGFMLMEMIVAITIMGIMLSMATPALLGDVDRARMELIKNDVSVMERQISEYLQYYPELPASTAISYEHLQEAAQEGRLYDAYGRTQIVYPGEYEVLHEEFSRISTLKGTFYRNEFNKVYYLGIVSNK